MSGYYRKALICLNGHCISSCIDAYPEETESFCSKCGAETITKCQNCETEIRGDYFIPDFGSFSDYKPPSYCYVCGKPFPWTESAIAATSELILEDEELTELEKQKLAESLPDILSETPRTQLATVRIKKAMLKAGKFTADAVRQFAIDFGCEFALKSMGISK